MKTKVTENGVTIPKQWFEGVTNVVIQKEQDVITISPISDNDPVFEIGKHSVQTDVDDASTNHDDYLY